MSDDNNKILDLGKLPRIKVPDLGKVDEEKIPDSPIASMMISVASNGGYSLTISFEDNLYPLTLIFQNKLELMAVLNTAMLR